MKYFLILALYLVIRHLAYPFNKQKQLVSHKDTKPQRKLAHEKLCASVPWWQKLISHLEISMLLSFPGKADSPCKLKVFNALTP